MGSCSCIFVVMAAPTNVNELAITYAALILHDDGIEITADKLTDVVKAAGITVQPVWARLFAKALASKDLDDLILNAGGSGAAAPAAAGGAAAAAGDALLRRPRRPSPRRRRRSLTMTWD